jgi:hypothetical protein
VGWAVGWAAGWAVGARVAAGLGAGPAVGCSRESIHCSSMWCEPVGNPAAASACKSDGTAGSVSHLGGGEGGGDGGGLQQVCAVALMTAPVLIEA